MSTQRIFSLLMIFFGVMGVIGASSLAMTRTRNIGPGAAPMIFAVLLIVFAAILFLKDKSTKKFNFNSLFKGTGLDALIFYAMNIVMAVLMHFFGTVIAMLVFSIMSLFFLRRTSHQKPLMIILFSVVWVGILYLAFVVALRVPFETGILFD